MAGSYQMDPSLMGAVAGTNDTASDFLTTGSLYFDTIERYRTLLS